MFKHLEEQKIVVPNASYSLCKLALQAYQVALRAQNPEYARGVTVKRTIKNNAPQGERVPRRALLA